MKLFGAAAFGICLADIGFDGAQENYVAEVGTDLLVSFAVTFPAGDNSDLTVVVRAEADGEEKEHKFFKLAPGKDPIKYALEADVTGVYVDMNDQIEATIDEAGDGRVMFNANLTAVTEEFDGTEFTVEADYGAYSDSTSFMLSAYKLPVLETTLLVDSVNENMNDTLRFIECSLNEAGYKPKEMEFGSVQEDVIIKIGDVQLMAQLDTNNTDLYFAELSSDDLQQASPISSLNGASATCEFSYSFLGQTFETNDDSANQLEFTYDPTFVTLSTDGSLIEKYDKHWGAEGQGVTVTCEADGNPKPELIITVDGQTAASGAGQDATSKLSTQHTISNTGEQIVTCEIAGTNSKNAVAQPITFDYHYLSDPVLSDNRVNATRNVFRAGEDSKNSVVCSADGRPNDINIDYTQNGGEKFNRDGLFTEAANLTISCLATNLLSGESKKTDMRIQVLPPLVPDEPESGGASIVVIIIVVLLVILLLGAIAFFIIKKRRESESESSAEGYAEGQPKSEAAGDDV